MTGYCRRTKPAKDSRASTSAANSDTLDSRSTKFLFLCSIFCSDPYPQFDFSTPVSRSQKPGRRSRTDHANPRNSFGEGTHFAAEDRRTGTFIPVHPIMHYQSVDCGARENLLRDSPNEPRTGVDGSDFLDWPEA